MKHLVVLEKGGDVRVNGRNRKLVILYNTNFIALTPYKKMNVLCYYSSLPLKILSKRLHLIITPLLGILQPPSLPGNSYLFYNIKFTCPPPPRSLLRLMAVLDCSVVSDSLWPHGLWAPRLLYPWGSSRREYWSGLSCPPPGDLPNPGIEPRSPALQVDYSPSESPGKPPISDWWDYCRYGCSLHSSVAQLCPTPYNPMNRSTPGLPVHHQLPSSPRLTSIELVMPSSHLILCRPLLLLPPIPPIIRVFSNESILRMKYPKHWSFKL